MDTAPLSSRIDRAFADVSRPGREDIAPHECLECDELRNDFALYSCDQLPESVLHRHLRDLPLLSAWAKQYYLPAWLHASLSHEDPWDIVDAVVFFLDSDHRVDPPGGYTQAQWQVLAEWIEHHQQDADEISREDLLAAQKRVLARLGA